MEFKKVEDAALLSKGGIDLNPAKLDLKLQNNGQGIDVRVDQAMLAQFQNTAGFRPVIINITPLPSLKNFLNS